ncbi:hypothetical protein REPUB_Repub07fG0151100 [Reevesia pubescens]
MAYDSASFSLSGPAHLTTIDWTNEHHRRSIAASLVQGVYVLERDRQKYRQGPQAYSPPWWESFNFKLNHLLIDDVDQCIFGAIYEFNPTAHNSSPQNAPNYVIAFRGTLNTPASISRDLRLNLLCICNSLHVSSRFQLAMKFVEDIAATATADGSNIWLAGHSLGSAMALQAGKNLTKIGCLVETYLFNPPFLSVPVEILIKHQALKNGIRFTTSVVNAALTIAIKGRHPKPEQDDPFTILSSWTPYLFVNPTDLICSEYKGYFEHRKKMEEIGAGKIERLSTQNSIVCLFSTVLKKNSEPLHLLPSAYLTINRSLLPNFRRAHGIEQWWDPNFNGQVELHQFK